jgi:diguanylate cyclase (GGDEF)-like protein
VATWLFGAILVLPAGAQADCPTLPTTVLSTPAAIDAGGVSPDVQSFIASDTGLDPTDILEQCERFQTLNNSDALSTEGEQVAWLGFQARFVDGPANAWLLRINNSGIERICLHWPTTSGQWQRQCAGHSIPLAQWPINHPRPLFQVPHDADSGRAVLVEAMSSRSFSPSLQFVTATTVLADESRQRFDSGAYYGIVILIALAAIAAGLALADVAFLWYGLHLLLMSLAFLGFSGMGSQLLSWTGGYFHYAYALAMLSGSFAFAARFARDFLSTKRRSPRVHRALILCEIYAFAAVIPALLMPRWGDPLVAVAILATVTTLFIAGIQRMRGGYRPALFVIVAFSVLAAGAVAGSLSILHVIELPAGSGSSITRAGAFLGALFMVGGLIHRTRTVRDQRDAAMDNALAQHRISLHRAHHDQLTGLGSRGRMLSLGAERMAATLVSGERLGLFIIDLDRFSSLEKTQPSPVIDRVMKTLASRLESIAEEDDLLARPNTDMFALLRSLDADGGSSEELLKPVAEQLRKLIADPMPMAEGELHLTATVGAAMAPSDASTFESLRAACNRAVIDGKNQGGNQAIVYHSGRHEVSAKRTAIQSELTSAIAGDQLTLHYQPMLDLASNRLLGYEALVRWLHPSRGQVPPDEFIPQIEGTHLMVAMGRKVQRMACEELQAWKGSGVTRLKIAINVSAIELQQPDFTEILLETIAEHGLKPSAVELELTESSLVQNLDQAALVLRQCREHGIGTMVDDFGTGYSSLAYIRDLPLAGVKIDRSFTRRIEDSDEDRTIVVTIIELAHNLGLKVVAEGVETQEQRRFLHHHGCDVIQGFLIGAAEPVAEPDRQPGAETRAAV